MRSEELRWQERILKRSVELPDERPNQRKKANNNWSDDRCTFPRILSATEVDADKEQSTPSREEKQADIVHFLHEVQFRFAVETMLGMKGRGLVKKEEEDASQCIERDHVPVGAPPADARVSNEGICC